MAKRLIGGAGVVLFYLLLWYVAARSIGKELLLPTPAAVLGRLGEMVGTAAFWRTTVTSMGRTLGGYALGVLAGAVLAVLCSISKLLGALIRPVVSVVRATPVASFIILVMFWLGTGGRVVVLMSFLMVMPVVFGNVLKGIEQTDRALLEMAQVFRAGRLRTAFGIYLPSLLPYLLAGAMTALGLGWKAGIAAEVLAAPKLSIGGALASSKIYLDAPSLFAWTLVIIVISMVLEALLRVGIAAAGKRVGALRMEEGEGAS